eukprot:Hpha_TRINITY_DN15764_c0_g6::TRINITY_DN15764_c0_g6_i1::g.41090::m.41090/K00166/BCKDHA, bkdA1; 2-oxoisovalerate dehydrogenase E1 component alpha subunit
MMRWGARVAALGAQRRACSSPADLVFRGTLSTTLTHDTDFVRKGGEFPILRQLLPSGELVEGVEQPFSNEDALKMYDCMVRSAVYDTILNDAQRQGRISFYMTNLGEEATSVGTAAALQPQDLMWPQYRELCMFLWRGLSLETIIDTCYCNVDCLGKGKNLPIFYMLPKSTGNPSLPVKAPLATYVSQAPGAGYAFKLRKEDKVSVVYFGDGAASEGDTPSGFNFAGVLGSQTLFVCRNNGFAISTPVEEQYSGDGIASRSVAFDVPSMRVDGNDVVAVYNATKAARELIIKERRSVLLELMTYRVGHHSTSDDSSAYRNDAERSEAAGAGPIRRFRRYLTKQGLWSDEQDKELRAKARTEIVKTLRSGGQKLQNNPNEMFEGVYDDLTPNLVEQREEMNRHLAANRGKYKPELLAKFKDL